MKAACHHYISEAAKEFFLELEKKFSNFIKKEK